MLAQCKHPDDTDKTAKKPKDTRGGSGSGGAGKREDAKAPTTARERAREVSRPRTT